MPLSLARHSAAASIPSISTPAHSVPCFAGLQASSDTRVGLVINPLGSLFAHLTRSVYAVGATSVEARVRAICTALPEVTEKLSHGAPAFFVGKQFLMLWSKGHHDHQFPHLWCAAPPDADWREIEAICEDAYRTVAPSKLVAALDAARPRSK